jgi:hypothetical protein
VVLPEGTHPARLLAPLDFDLAYDRKDFIGPETSLQEWTALEANGLVAALAGDEAVNSGVSGTADLQGELGILRWILRYTICLL